MRIFFTTCRAYNFYHLPNPYEAKIEVATHQKSDSQGGPETEDQGTLEF